MGRARLVAGVAALAVCLLAVPGAGAFTPPPPGLTCTYAGAPTNTVTFTIETGEETVVLRRVGDEIKLLSEDVYGTVRRKGKRKKTVWHRIFQPATCNATPTVQNTDAIRVRIEADEIVDIDISLDGGPLAPGATTEADGTSEIEVTIEPLGGDRNIRFVGTPQSDWFRFGSNGSAPGIPGVNLNAQEESSSPDVDATVIPFAAPTEPGVYLVSGMGAITGGGDDTVTSGGPEFANASFASIINGGPGNDMLIAATSPYSIVKGGGGDDAIQGGLGRNFLFGGGGADTITGGPGRDFVEPGKGRDRAVLDGGRDIVASYDHAVDHIQCGDRRDVVGKDRKDRTPGCERKYFVPFHLKPFAD
jgi:Ca2+-binding RTX toxin-like protein